MFSRDYRRHVAWDIETTGLGWSDRITVSGFWLPNGAAEIVLNTAGDTIDTDVYEQYLESHCGIPITLHPTNTESELQEQMHHIIFERFEALLKSYSSDISTSETAVR